MGIVRMGRCASCGTPVLWLRAWGFGEPRPLELHREPDGEVVIDPVEAGHRPWSTQAVGEGAGEPHRYRLHWPCPGLGLPAPRPLTADRHGRPQPGGEAPPDGGAPSTPALTVAVVPHTHWDREWYLPFQSFRLRLLHVLDQVLDLLETEPSFAHFVLDGQTAMVDDYLELRPGAEDRIRTLARSGRLSLGPWHAQPDQFLISGETLVRDLQAGIARSGELGRTMEVGYLPDSFGHAAQMPQLLRRAGIRHAVVSRGVPVEVGSTGFWWEAPDGSRVRAEHLALGYSSGVRLPEDPDALVAWAAGLAAALGDRRAGDLLVMNGGDHEPPRPWAGRVVAEADRRGDRFRFVLSGLQEFVERQPVDGLPVWRGELRASGPSAVLMGVTSNHVDVRLAAAAAERAVERRAEPLCALFVDPQDHPHALLGAAWRRLLDNAAHDSVCACSADEVVDQVLVRYAEARQIGEGLAGEAVAALAGRVAAPPGSLLVANPSGHARRGTVRFTAPGSGPLHLEPPGGGSLPCQVLDERQPVELVAGNLGRDIDVVLDLFGAGTFAGHRVARWHPAPDRLGVILEMAAPGEATADIDGARRLVSDLAAQHPEETVDAVLLRAPVRDVLALSSPVAGFGWVAHRVFEGEGPSTAVTGGDRWVANEHLRVEVDRASGTLTVSTADGVRATGLNRYVDGGDAGDTYNWSPPLSDRLVDVPGSVEVSLVESGPVRARLVVRATYPWAAPTSVQTVIDVVAGERVVRIETSFLNTRCDHRLRVHFPLPVPVSGTDAECAFAVVRRGLTHEGNPLEAGLATYPARRFVDCSDGITGLALLHDGVAEYEVVDGGRELALTLLRSVGLLSRDDGILRPVEAGPAVAVPHAQQLGPYRRSYAILLHHGSWTDAGLHAEADNVLLPLEHAWVEESTGAVPPAGAFLSVDGAEVTAVTRHGEGVAVRMVRARPHPGTVGIRWRGAPARGWTMDLRGRLLEPVEGSLRLDPWEIATVRLDAP